MIYLFVTWAIIVSILYVANLYSNKVTHLIKAEQASELTDVAVDGFILKHIMPKINKAINNGEAFISDTFYVSKKADMIKITSRLANLGYKNVYVNFYSSNEMQIRLSW